jgi:hypothetical protein
VQNYYRILEVDYDAAEETIRSNYIRLALVRDFSIIFHLWFLLRLCSRVGKKRKRKERDRRRKG